MATQPKHLFHLTDSELAVLEQFIRHTSLYVEALEDLAHAEQTDFWQQRTGAMHVVTEMMIERILQQRGQN